MLVSFGGEMDVGPHEGGLVIADKFVNGMRVYGDLFG
jgi:hypothetical protein